MSKREIQESKENLETIDNAAPKGRFQNSQQVQNTMDVDAKTDNGGFQLKKQKATGSQLKQEAVAKVLNNADSGSANSGMGISAGGLRGVSGAEGGVLGAANGTPIADKSRSNSRYGKKLDRMATKINFTPCEQVVQEYDESKPLADAADADQGYNGTYRNEYARSQKVVGNTPAELLFDRSVDYISKDELYFGEGQYVKQQDVVYDDAPTCKAEINAYGVREYPRDEYGKLVNNWKAQPGNYLHRNMHVSLDAQGKVNEIYFDVENITPEINAERANRASAAAMIDRNSAELNRQSMDAKAGDEKADIWTPLARAIEEPTKVVGMLRDFEAITGNEVYLGYRKATTAMAHQLNRAAKDGQELVGPAVEALLGTIESPNEASVINTAYPTLKSVLDPSVHAKALNSKGCPGLMIAAYDSVAKYNTKQDLLLQPRGFRMHLQTADNNMNPLRVHKLFAQAVDANEVYSTIDREYDPMLPICITDKAAVVHRYNLNNLFAKRLIVDSFSFETGVSGSTEFVKRPLMFPEISEIGTAGKRYIHVLQDDKSTGHGKFVFSTDTFTPNTDMDADVVVKILIDDHATSYGTTGIAIDGTTYYEFTTPIDPCDSTYKGKALYINIPNDVEDELDQVVTVFEGGEYIYTYSDIRNKYVVKVNVPLIQGIIEYLETVIGAKFYTLINNGELTIPMVHSTESFSLWDLILCAATPYIINNRINSMRDILYYEKNVEYPFNQLETIGAIGVKSYSNFNFIDYDNPIVVGQMKPAAALRWTIPEMFWIPKQVISSSHIAENYVVMPFYMNQENFKLKDDGTAELEDDHAAMTMPSIRSGARLAFLDNLYGMEEKDIRLSYDCALPFIPELATGAFVYKYGRNTDGVIGFKLEATGSVPDGDISIKEWLSQPREIGYVIDAPYGVLTGKVVGSITAGTIATSKAAFTESATRGNSFRVRCWAGQGFLKHVTSSGTDSILQAKDINVNRAANFRQTWYEVFANGKRPTFDAGMLFSLNHLLNEGSLVKGVSEFTPLFNEVTGYALASTNVISFMKAFWTRIQKLPFVVSPFEGADIGSDSYATTVDPYEIAYYFGLCGFRASDYRESIYNREKEVVNQGYLFVSDPWVEASPIFKEGAVSSGIVTTKGYEV